MSLTEPYYRDRLIEAARELRLARNADRKQKLVSLGVDDFTAEHLVKGVDPDSEDIYSGNFLWDNIERAIGDITAKAVKETPKKRRTRREK